MSDSKTQVAIDLMMDFAKRTGLTTQRQPQRYLWTDAFAVCNFLGLAHVTADERYEKLALQLVDQVHHTLGQHRTDDRRSGWISGLNSTEGENHPTRGGLRIGKRLPEREPNERFDERLEWERDGQYFHYLTKWMHALDQLTRSTGRPLYNQWARELAETALNAFTCPAPQFAGSMRMYWKMSIDLTRALVPSMGQHDPLDGYITAVQLATTAAHPPEPGGDPTLTNEINLFGAMIHGGEWESADPLGIGGLLTDAQRVAQLSQQGAVFEKNLLEKLLSDALTGLHQYTRNGELQRAAEYRLAFRELGLAIGLSAMERIRLIADRITAKYYPGGEISDRLQALRQYTPLIEDIESFWLRPENRRTGTWLEHRDINEVMLATSLVPDGFRILNPGRGTPPS